MTATSGPFQPRNALEHALIKAAGDPSHRGPFVRELLEATVIVVGDPGSDGPGSALAVKWGTMPDGRPCIPFYSSPEWLMGVIERSVPTLSMPARSLFAGAPGATLALNLGAPWAKEFTPDEVRSLVGGGGGEAAASALGNPTEVVVGMPEVEPTAYLAAAKEVFARHPEVKAAYLGWIHYPDAGTPPHLIIGVEGDGDLKDAMFDASSARDSADDPSALVDFLAVTWRSDGLGAWLMNEGRKFYEA